MKNDKSKEIAFKMGETYEELSEDMKEAEVLVKETLVSMFAKLEAMWIRRGFTVEQIRQKWVEFAKHKIIAKSLFK